ncbi:MAG: hypothetical protein VX871_06555 [Pseudomonadota bacterium]|nr:hypothetical protein [Pseudomonadota bacterium]
MTSEPSAGVLVHVGVAFVYLMFATVAAMGLLSLYAGIDILWTGRESVIAGVIAAGMGTVFALIGLGFFYIKFFRSRVWAAREARLKAQYPEQPWMMRADWRARRVTHSNAGAMIFMWIWTLGWWRAFALIGRLNRDKIWAALQESWADAAACAVFVLAGLLGLTFAIKLTRAHRRFGVTSLAIETLPGYLGERFRGTVSAGLPKRPMQPLEAELRCELLTEKRRRVSGKTQTSIESTALWRITQRIFPTKITMIGERAQIPVSIDLPPGQPETSLRNGLGIRWVLDVQTSGRPDPSFSCSFEVPVYRKERTPPEGSDGNLPLPA